MNDDITVNGEPMGLAAVGTTDVHLRGIPLIEPRRKKVRVTRPDKAPPRRRASGVSVSWTPKGVGWRTAKGRVRCE